MQESAQYQLTTPWELSKIHWKSEALSNLFFGLPLALLMIISWQVGTAVFVKIILLYLGTYAFIYVPFFGIFPHVTYKPAWAISKRIMTNEATTDEDIVKLLAFMINYPVYTGIKIFFVVTSAFLFAALLLWMRIIPELGEITTLAGSAAVVLGVIVSITESLLNIIFMEQRLSKDTEYLMSKYPNLDKQQIPIRSIPLGRKVLFFALITALAGQATIFLFFLTITYLYNYSRFMEYSVYTLILIGLNAVYLIVLAPAASRTLTDPLKKTIEWSKHVRQGDTNSKLHMITNDEISDVARYSNEMVTQLSEVQQKLQASMNELSKEQVLLKTERNKLDAVIAGVIDGVVALDEQKNIIVFNEAMERITGWKESEVLNKPIDAIIQLTDKDGNHYFSDDYCRPVPTPLQETPNTVEKNLLNLTTKGQNIRIVNLTATIIHESSQPTATYIVALHDATKEHQIETMKLDIVSMAAHELRTPLTAINGYMSVILSEFSDRFGEEENTFLQRVQISAQQLASLVDNLLNVTRLERSTLELHPENVNWIKLLRDIVDEFRFQAKEKKITVHLQEPMQEFPTIFVDKLRMSEVLMNLISNAIKYTEVGGNVYVSTELTETAIITHVQDTGVGIPQKSLPQLFSKFYRVDNRLSTQNKGTGLGLYITRAIVELHHGTIWVQSEVDKGSTFSFSIPLTPPQQVSNANVQQ